MGRGKFVLDAGALHRLLGLPPEVRVVFAYAEPDPTAVHVVVEGEQLPSYGMGELRRLLVAQGVGGGTPVLAHPVNNPATTVDWGSAA
jgi:hypothetical protein